jgi:hypothetical protein
LNPTGAVWTTTRRPTPFRRFLSPDGRFRVQSCAPGCPTSTRGCPSVWETFGRRQGGRDSSAGPRPIRRFKSRACLGGRTTSWWGEGRALRRAVHRHPHRRTARRTSASIWSLRVGRRRTGVTLRTHRGIASRGRRPRSPSTRRWGCLQPRVGVAVRSITALPRFPILSKDRTVPGANRRRSTAASALGAARRSGSSVAWARVMASAWPQLRAPVRRERALHTRTVGRARDGEFHLVPNEHDLEEKPDSLGRLSLSACRSHPPR